MHNKPHLMYTFPNCFFHEMSELSSHEMSQYHEYRLKNSLVSSPVVKMKSENDLDTFLFWREVPLTS